MFVLVAPGARAEPAGALDTSFGSGGLAVTPAGRGGWNALVSLPGGQLLAAGSCDDQNRIGVAKILPDGSPDRTFGHGTGRVCIPVVAREGGWDRTRTLTVLHDGDILVGAYTTDQYRDNGAQRFDRYLVLLRLLPDGSVDTSFGTSGYVLDPVGNPQDQSGDATSIFEDDQGRIVVFSPSDSQQAAMLRYLPNGTRDPSFATGGMATYTLPGITWVYDVLASQVPGGYVVIAYDGLSGATTVMRVDDDGALDTGFGSGGTVPITGHPDLEVGSITPQLDGRIILTGVYAPSGVNRGFVMRLNADGSPDFTFGGGDGFIEESAANSPNSLTTTVVGRGGDLIGVGSATGTDRSQLMGIIRLTAHGTPDPRFYYDGTLVVTGTVPGALGAAVMQADGNVVAAGTVFRGYRGASFDPALVRICGNVFPTRQAAPPKGTAGPDHLYGTCQNDVLSGGAGNDVISGGLGSDQLKGDAGNDDLTGLGGNDTEFGGAGSDTLSGGNGADTLAGGTGNDQLSGGAGPDTISGGTGNDTITAGPGSDHVNGGPGNDVIHVRGGGKDTVTCGPGNDTVYASANDRIAPDCEHVHRS
jgi:uncharacterized delta-60 repeat protein